jgi:hypothetical protein
VQYFLRCNVLRSPASLAASDPMRAVVDALHAHEPKSDLFNLGRWIKVEGRNALLAYMMRSGLHSDDTNPCIRSVCRVPPFMPLPCRLQLQLHRQSLQSRAFDPRKHLPLPAAPEDRQWSDEPEGFILARDFRCCLSRWFDRTRVNGDRVNGDAVGGACEYVARPRSRSCKGQGCLRDYRREKTRFHQRKYVAKGLPLPVPQRATRRKRPLKKPKSDEALARALLKPALVKMAQGRRLTEEETDIISRDSTRAIVTAHNKKQQELVPLAVSAFASARLPVAGSHVAPMAAATTVMVPTAAVVTATARRPSGSRPGCSGRRPAGTLPRRRNDEWERGAGARARGAAWFVFARGLFSRVLVFARVLVRACA